jgi:hypothetical protein
VCDLICIPLIETNYFGSQNNGRLAMIGIAGFVAQELVDGQTIFGKRTSFVVV